MINFKKHKAMKPLFIISLVLSLLIFVFLVIVSYLSFKNIISKNTLSQILAEDDWLLVLIGYFGGYAIIILIVITIIYVLMQLANLNVTAIAHDIPVTEKQFPELLKFEAECAKKLGLKEVPNLYVDPAWEGEEKILGAKFENGHILRIDASEVYNTADEDYYLAKFTIARKLAAIYLGDYNVALNAAIFFSHWIPILSQVNNRVICYMCDKIAVELLDKETVIKALITKYTGYYITPFVNKEEYIDSLEKILKVKDVIFENLFLDIPLAAYRLEAIIKDIDGRLF